MLKPVTILSLDDPGSSLAEGVRRRVVELVGVDDLVQARALAPGGDITPAIESIHARRQAPNSAIRTRDDISNRELILLIVSAAGPARTNVFDVVREIRRLYDMRRFAAFYTIELLCLLPDLGAASSVSDYGAAYSLLKTASGIDPRPFDAMWLLSSENAKRVRFGPLDESPDAYIEAIAGSLVYEPELSGALASYRPRGAHATFSSFGFAELVFPRDGALQRLESRFANDLVRAGLLAPAATAGAAPQLAAKRLVAGDEFSVPLSRIGVEAGQSLFKRFQPKTLVNERTRNADELIGAVRIELKAHRDSTHLSNLQALTAQADQTAQAHAALVSRVVDEALDTADYPAATRLLDALLDPLPDLHTGVDLAPRNLATEIRTATAALDARLRFVPNTAESDAMRKRVRELDNILTDQKLVADVLSASSAAEQLAAMEKEKDDLSGRLPDVLFAEETENNAARNTAREAESSRLAQETESREQQLRELFAARPRAEQALREALEERRAFIFRQFCWAILGITAIYGIPFAVGALRENLSAIHWTAFGGLPLFALFAFVRYSSGVGARLRAAREALQRINEQIQTTDKAKNNAHNDELQFEYDVAHRRAALQVLRRTRETAKATLDALRQRLTELEELAASFTPAAIEVGGVSIAVVDDADVDAWYERTTPDRKLFFLDFPIRRSESLRLTIEELRSRVAAYAATGFDNVRKLTLPQALAIVPEEKAEQRLKRFADSSAPLVDVRDDDLDAEQAMQRDTTLWVDSTDLAFVARIRRRLPNATVKPAHDPFTVHAVTRVLHYPAYVLGQIEYYRSQYDSAQYPESAEFPDLIPLPTAVRDAYEQVILGRAVGALRVREDGRIARATGDVILGDSHLDAAEHLAASQSASIRRDIESDIAARLSIAKDVESDVRQLADGTPPLSLLDRGVVATLIKRYAGEV